MALTAPTKNQGHCNRQRDQNRSPRPRVILCWVEQQVVGKQVAEREVAAEQDTRRFRVRDMQQVAAEQVDIDWQTVEAQQTVAAHTNPCLYPDHPDHPGADRPEADLPGADHPGADLPGAAAEHMADNAGTERCPCSVECHSQQTYQRYFAFARNPEALPARYS
tara:strand:- start:3364 stop:3855 length:492 start_codon:yes stop_codon:yes gene_type:complete